MNSPRQALRSTLFAFLLLLANSVGAQQVENVAPANEAMAAPADSGVVAPLEMSVPVMINGQGPFEFIIDTASSTAVIAQDLAERLQLPSGGKTVIHAMGGIAEVRSVKIDNLTFSTTSVDNIKALTVARRNLGADGLLGIKQLKDKRVIMDFVTNTMRIEPSSSKSDTKPEVGKNVIVVIGRSRLGQLVLADADANGQKVWVIVDTGSGDSVGNRRLMSLLTRRDPRTEMRPIALIDVLGRATPADYTYVKMLRIGGVEISNPAIAFADVYPFKIFGLTRRPSLLLGMDTLGAFRRVTIDFPARKAYFEMPAKAATEIRDDPDKPKQLAEERPIRIP